MENDEQMEHSVSHEDSKWYRDVKSSWHPGVTLRNSRENAGYTQAALAFMPGIAAANISAIENGRRSMAVNAAKKFAETL
jgi:predicted transcriptional regulator